MLSWQAAHIQFVVLCRHRPWAQRTYILQSHLQFASCQISVSFIIPVIISEYFCAPRQFFFHHQEKEPENIPKATFTFSETEVSQNTDKGAPDVSKTHMFP